MRAFNVVSVCILLVVLLGCAGFGGPPFDESRYPINEPAAADLAGLYRPTDATRSFIAKDGQYPAKDISIVLEPKGTVQLRNIPDWWQNGFGKSNGGFDSWTGTWSTWKRPSRDWWELSLVLSDPGGFGTSVELIGQQAPYRIALVVGDPDSGREMQFERVGPPDVEEPKGGKAQAK
jgi:hypothetical protein